MSVRLPDGVEEDDRLARLALAQVTEPGDPRVGRLVRHLGACTLLRHLATPSGLTDTQRREVQSDMAARFADLDPRAELERGTRQGFRYVVPGDEEWPTQLSDLDGAGVVQGRSGAPVGLWVRGPFRINAPETSVAVVGSRSATGYGEELARRWSAEVSAAGVTVVSGAAYGIDQAAHRGALAAKIPTVAVLACGVDRFYPAVHADLLRLIGDEGAIISEAPLGFAPMRLRFLARNRLIAALTGGTLVVEAAHRSGALNTANWATRLHRHLLGVPGPVTQAQSEGVHELIRNGAATLVSQADHVLEILGRPGEHLPLPPRGESRPRDGLSLIEAQVLDATPYATPVGADSIARAAGIARQKVADSLESLSERGLAELTGKGWRLGSRAR